MTDWRDRVDDLLFDGERVTESVDVPAGRLVVTTHRLLAFTPDAEGANFRAVDRPNVDDVRTSAGGSRRYLRWTLRPLLVGGLLLVAGTQLDIGDPLSGVDTSGAGGTGAGGILSSVASFTSLLAVLDEVMVWVGALCLLVVAALLGVYLYSRERLLVVEVAGDDDVELPVPGDTSETVSRLEVALAADGGPDSAAAEESAVGAVASGPDGDGDRDGDGTADEDDAPRTVEDVLGDADDPPFDDPTVPVEPDPSTPPTDDDATVPDRSDAGDGGK